MKYVEGGSAGTQELANASEKWLDELRVKKFILLKAVEKNKRRKNNATFVKDEWVFYKKGDGTKKLKGEPPTIGRFVQFWGGMLEQEKTIEQPWMAKVREVLKKKISDVQDIQIRQETIGKAGWEYLSCSELYCGN